jgi:WhiB family transcriptional regulator, redox-sensing transcriptional regulator
VNNALRPPDGSLAWQSDAACRDVDPDLFFPSHPPSHPDNRPSVRARVEEPAKQVCRACPVVDPCLEYAVTRNQDDGIWGGLNEDERRSLRRRLRRGAQELPL